MTLNLDPVTQQRIQREIDLGHFQEPAEVIAHALDLLDAQEDWLMANREAISQRIDRSFEQASRGETHSPEGARQILAERLAARNG